MKKILLIAAAFVTFNSCTKSVVAPEQENSTERTIMEPIREESATNVRATVAWTADPAVDGLGWILRLSDDRQVIPKSIPEPYMKHGMQVIVSYKQTNERFPCRCSEPQYYVEITEIHGDTP
jgi:hypothetical protein